VPPEGCDKFAPFCLFAAGSAYQEKRDMNNAPLTIDQIKLDEIAAQLRIPGSLAVLLSLFQEINHGRTVKIIENGAVAFETKSCDELSNHILSRAQPVPKDSPLLKNRDPTNEPSSGSI